MSGYFYGRYSARQPKSLGQVSGFLDTEVVVMQITLFWIFQISYHYVSTLVGMVTRTHRERDFLHGHYDIIMLIGIHVLYSNVGLARTQHL